MNLILNIITRLSISIKYRTSILRYKLGIPNLGKRFRIKRKRNLTSWDKHVSYKNLSDFETNFKDENHIYTIDLNPPIDCLFRKGSGNTIFIFFNAALEQKNQITLPKFSWLNISKNACRGNCVFVSDPSLILSEELFCAWYIGSKKQPLQPILANMFEIIRKKCCATRFVFVGSSGGGYPALFYALTIDSSMAFVNAPTTNIQHHHNIIKTEKYRLACFNTPWNKISKDYNLNIQNLFSASPKNPILITLNKSDVSFIKFHIKPIIKKMNLIWTNSTLDLKKFKIIVGNWSKGHSIPNKSDLIKILTKIEACPGKSFEKLDLKKLTL